MKSNASIVATNNPASPKKIWKVIDAPMQTKEEHVSDSIVLEALGILLPNGSIIESLDRTELKIKVINNNDTRSIWKYAAGYLGSIEGPFIHYYLIGMTDHHLLH